MACLLSVIYHLSFITYLSSIICLSSIDIYHLSPIYHLSINHLSIFIMSTYSLCTHLTSLVSVFVSYFCCYSQMSDRRQKLLKRGRMYFGSVQKARSITVQEACCQDQLLSVVAWLVESHQAGRIGLGEKQAGRWSWKACPHWPTSSSHASHPRVFIESLNSCQELRIKHLSTWAMGDTSHSNYRACLCPDLLRIILMTCVFYLFVFHLGYLSYWS